MNGLIRCCTPNSAPTVDRLFNEFFNEPFFAAISRPSAETPHGTLALDLSEDDKSVIVRASLPGFSKENIDAEIHDGVLSIKAERAEETEQKGETYVRRERRFGSVSRRVQLPADVIEDQTQADLKDGVLTLRIPKSQKATPRKVRIG
ncbi:MAG: Hsp20/alpha crystallin family protein [Phycisphaerales bacterium]